MSSSRLSLAALALVATTAVTFFIVEHSLTMSTTSESFESTEFVEAEVDSDVETGSSLRRVAFLAFGGVGGLALALSRRRFDLTHPAVWAAIGLVGWTYLSAGWSVDSGLTIRRLVVVTLTLIGLLGWTRLLTPEQSVRAILLIAGGYLALGVLCELGLRTFRPWSGLYRFSGTTHPNTQGILCGILLIGSCVRLAQPRRKLLWLAVAAAALLFLYLTKSRTTLGASLIAVAAVFWLRARWPMRVGSLLLGGLVGSGSLLFALLFLPDAADGVTDALLMGRQEEVTTLTGRLPLWAELWHDFARRPLHGYGYGAFWNPTTLFRVAQNQGWQIPHSHSGYFETALNLGLVGLALTLFAVGGTLVAAWRTDRRSRSLASGFPIGLVVFAGVYSLADAGFALPTFASFALAATVLQTPRLRDEDDAARFVPPVRAATALSRRDLAGVT